MLALGRRLLQLSRSRAHSALHHLLLSSHFSSKSPPSPAETSPPPFMVEYLTRSVGLTEKEAAAASKPISRIRSFPQNPDSVLEYLRSVGFSESHIRDLIRLQPKILSCRVEKTLKPKFQLLQDLGLSGSELADFLLNRCMLRHICRSGQLSPMINYLRSFLSNEQVVLLLKRATRSTWLFAGGVQRLRDNISAIQKRGIPDKRWRQLLLSHPTCFLRRHEFLNSLMDRVEIEFGIPPDSSSFLHGVSVLSSQRAGLESKALVFESSGWSKSDWMSLFRNLPICFAFSETRIRRSLEFLMGEVGLEPSYIASHQSLLTLSLEKRIAPRYKCLSALKSKNLVGAKPGFYSVVLMTEKVFAERFLEKFKHESPDVYEAYISSTEHYLIGREKLINR